MLNIHMYLNYLVSTLNGRRLESDWRPWITSFVVKKQKKINLDKLASSQGYAYKWIGRGGGGRGHGRRPNLTVQSRNDQTTYKCTQGGAHSPSDPKHKKHPEMSSQMREQATGSNLTSALQGILSRGVPLDPALALQETKKQGNLSTFVYCPSNLQNPTTSPSSTS